MPRSDPVLQSVLLPGSLSWSPAYPAKPVHWFSTATSRIAAARTFGTSNDRMISVGATGRGRFDGNASPGET